MLVRSLTFLRVYSLIPSSLGPGYKTVPRNPRLGHPISLPVVFWVIYSPCPPNAFPCLLWHLPGLTWECCCLFCWLLPWEGSLVSKLKDPPVLGLAPGSSPRPGSVGHTDPRRWCWLDTIFLHKAASLWARGNRAVFISSPPFSPLQWSTAWLLRSSKGGYGFSICPMFFLRLGT